MAKERETIKSEPLRIFGSSRSRWRLAKNIAKVWIFCNILLTGYQAPVQWIVYELVFTSLYLQVLFKVTCSHKCSHVQSANACQGKRFFLKSEDNCEWTEFDITIRLLVTLKRLVNGLQACKLFIGLTPGGGLSKSFSDAAKKFRIFFNLKKRSLFKVKKDILLLKNFSWFFDGLFPAVHSGADSINRL